MLRRVLDTLYLAGGVLAAASILAICLLVSAQVALNILARIGGPDWSYTIPSYADFSGFLLAAATFLAMAHTLQSGVHIRVTLLTSRLGAMASWTLEMVTLAIGLGIAAYASRFAIGLTLESHDYGDMSTGIVPVPLWIPQVFMDIGLVLLTLCFLDMLVRSARARHCILVDAGEA